jgi:hypothetical protein
LSFRRLRGESEQVCLRPLRFRSRACYSPLMRYYRTNGEFGQPSISIGVWLVRPINCNTNVCRLLWRHSSEFCTNLLQM